MGLFDMGELNVTVLKLRKDVDGLVKALGSEKDHDAREAAAEALGEIGDSRVVEPLVAALGDTDDDVREAAAEALGKIGDPRAVDPLTAALNDPDHDVRKEAEKALAKLR